MVWDEMYLRRIPGLREDDWFRCGEGTRLFLRKWPVPGDAGNRPRALLCVVHGMAEHAGRYDRLAERLAGAGIEVWAADLRGHGRTADLAVNHPGRGGLLGHCRDRNGFAAVCVDIHNLNHLMLFERPGIPLFLLGHSWGSFLSQDLISSIERMGSGGRTLAGCILSGTRNPGGLKVQLGSPFLSLLAGLRGSRSRSELARALADGPYRKAFLPARTPFDWLSGDEVDAYIADPLCGMLCSLGFYRDLAYGLRYLNSARAGRRIRRDLPILILGGKLDPVGDFGAGPEALAARYRRLGLEDVGLVLYPDARHEIFNDTCREEAATDLISWICDHLSGTEEHP